MSAEGVCYRICAHPRCYGASVSFRKGLLLLCGSYVAAGVYWRISRPSAAEYAALCIPIGYTAGAWGTRTCDALGYNRPSDFAKAGRLDCNKALIQTQSLNS
jgi:hypothetical protein